MVSPWTPRRRRRRGLWIAALFTAGALLLVGSGQVRSEPRTLAAYLDLSRSVADSEARLASTFQDVVTGLGRMERPALVTALDDLEAKADGAVTALAKADRPESAQAAHGYLTVALASWRDGLAVFSESLMTVVDRPEDPTGRTGLESAMLDLLVGDRAYSRFRVLAAELHQELDVEASAFPEVRFMPAAGTGSFTAGGIAERATVAEQLVLRRDLAVATLRVDPRPIGDREGVPVVPFSEQVDVQVSVVNKGNQPETAIRVVLHLVRDDTAEYEEEAVLDELAPGASRTVTFADVPAQTGQRSVVFVDVRPVDGETAVEDNMQQLAFFRNTDE